jgi:rubrerythrin
MFGLHPLDTWFHERRQKNIHMAHNEVVESVRLAIIAELDLVNYYEQIANATREESVKRVFEDLAKEGIARVGLLLGLLSRLDPGAPRRIREGIKRFEERIGTRVEL